MNEIVQIKTHNHNQIKYLQIILRLWVISVPLEAQTIEKVMNVCTTSIVLHCWTKQTVPPLNHAIGWDNVANICS